VCVMWCSGLTQEIMRRSELVTLDL
jgi:hypothetical protein